MGLLGWVILGLVAGAVAQWLVPTRTRDGCGGCVVTMIIGLVGAAVGGFIGTAIGWGSVDSFDLRSTGLAIIGAVVVLLLLRAIRERS